MSNKALNWAWSVQDLHPVEKLVLVALADHANKDTLQCNPGLECLTKWSCASRRGVQNAVAVLIERGFIQRDLRVGLGATYTLLTRAVSAPPTPATSARVTPATSAPPPRPNGADPHPPPVQPLPGTRAVSAPEPFFNPESKTSKGSPAVTRATPQRHFPLPVVVSSNSQPASRHRLPQTWVPSADDRAYAADRKLNPDDLLLDFRAHFDNAPDSKALKSDWSQAWQWWCRNEVKFFGRDRGTRRVTANDVRAETRATFAAMGLRGSLDDLKDALDPDLGLGRLPVRAVT